MNKQINRLFQKFVDKTIAPEELKLLCTHIQGPRHAPQIEGLLTELGDYIGLAEETSPQGPSEEEARELQRKRLLLEALMNANSHHGEDIETAFKKINKEYNSHPVANKKTSWLDWFKKLFGVVLVVAAAGTWYYFRGPAPITGPAPAYVEKVSGFGQKSTIALPDGSQVKLNAGSKVRYPRTFEKNSRQIFLEDGALFQVTRDENRPFTVRTGELVTTVPGTSFNIKACENGDIAATVATGKVRVGKGPENNSGECLSLAPNGQAVYSLPVGVGASKSSRWLLKDIRAGPRASPASIKQGWGCGRGTELLVRGDDRWGGVCCINEPLIVKT